MTNKSTEKNPGFGKAQSSDLNLIVLKTNITLSLVVHLRLHLLTKGKKNKTNHSVLESILGCLGAKSKVTLLNY